MEVWDFGGMRVWAFFCVCEVECFEVLGFGSFGSL